MMFDIHLILAAIAQHPALTDYSRREVGKLAQRCISPLQRPAANPRIVVERHGHIPADLRDLGEELRQAIPDVTEPSWWRPKLLRVAAALTTPARN